MHIAGHAGSSIYNRDSDSCLQIYERNSNFVLYLQILIWGHTICLKITFFDHEYGAPDIVSVFSILVLVHSFCFFIPDFDFRLFVTRKTISNFFLR